MLTGKVWGDRMRIYRKGLDKWALTPIIRQTNRQDKSVSFFCPEFHIAIQKDVLRPRLFRGCGAFFFCFGSSGAF